MKEIDLLIIGGGSAGMAAAISAKEQGIENILILEQNMELGGILNQCIHNGFGLHYFKEELAGPQFAKRLIDEIQKKQIDYLCEACVLEVKYPYVSFSSKHGYETVKCKAIILAMGCRERSAGAIELKGDRGSGIYSAGCAQYYLNIEGKLVGKRVVILGSGDIGLIMARRMTLEGVKVLAVCEVLPYSSGLPRNIAQCLEDFNIPLYLSHTVSKVTGRDRVESITISQVDENGQIISNTEKIFQADTLLLSVGLIPENTLAEKCGITLHPKTKGAIVNQHYMTNVEGIFACGNVLHVHDIVDYVTLEGRSAGACAAKYIKNGNKKTTEISCIAKNGISYILPQIVSISKDMDDVIFSFRSNERLEKVTIVLSDRGKELKRFSKPVLLPAEMERFVLSKELCLQLDEISELWLEVKA